MWKRSLFFVAICASFYLGVCGAEHLSGGRTLVYGLHESRTGHMSSVAMFLSNDRWRKCHLLHLPIYRFEGEDSRMQTYHVRKLPEYGFGLLRTVDPV
jgi:hypothetical protein